MSTDPRSLNYPTVDDADRAGDELADSGAPETGPGGNRADRRTGTNDELKELDRAERRKK
jgi:hypothetical protein